MADPALPAATVPCPATPGKLCVSDADTGGLIAAFAAALDKANGKLLWLRDYFTALPGR